MTQKVTENEMIEALKRSGYLLESEISSLLSNSGFFVEGNQVILDPSTGKSREIDLLAEYYHRHSQSSSALRCCAKVKFVFEIKNNIYPLVLLTQFEFSPNIEDWMGLKEALNLPEGVQYTALDSYYEYLISKRDGHIFSQYCTFHKKKSKDDLMAVHPENLYAGLTKLVQYCEEQVEIMDTDMIYESSHDEEKDDYFRHFLYLPILLINDDLYEYNDGKIVKRESSILVFNYHYKNEPKMAYVFVVTKQGFNSFMEQTIEVERNTESLMRDAKSKSV